MPASLGHTETNTGWLATVLKELRAKSPPAAALKDRLRIAGHDVVIRYAEAELAAALGRATRHLRIGGSGAAGLTIDCWIDPDIALGPQADWPDIGITHTDDGEVTLTWDAPGGPIFAYHRDEHRAWAVFGAAHNLPAWEQATPFRRVLHWWAADQGLQLVHAAAVGYAAGGVLLVGRSGSGKSTTALACMEAGLQFAGDDYCLLASGEPPWVHGLYLSGKGDTRTAALLPGLSASFASSPLRMDGKSIVFADEFRPAGVCAGFPLRGIVVPRLTGESGSGLAPIRPAEALRALAPSTLLQMPGRRAGGLARLAAIVHRLPARELRLGSDPAAGAVAIREFLDEQAGT